ncbi:hypothetical protein [Rhabdothermincola salaria]|uniref:hypothetical protein n=1 Tax=Rhabdothermincola salaria TaxID=2903142 RepID=UPI001E4858A4|nr:hypothetical protein [Rhabdothermincola salaria]MCD9624431.1 hypothetical protein [Rhabdothermincola salaria]
MTDTDGADPAPDPRGSRVVRLVGVYHAKGSLTGEVAYWVGARLGRAHCALCDITHGPFRAKPEFARCAAGLPVPFDLVHLDERAPEVVALTDGRTPCVVALVASAGSVSDRTEAVMVLDAGALDACGGEPEALVRALEAAVDDHGLRWS